MDILIYKEPVMEEGKEKEVLVLVSNQDKASYSLGFEMGRGLRAQFADLNFHVFTHALRDAFNDYTPRVKEEEMREILSVIQQQMMEKQKQFLTKMAADNQKASEEFLEQNKTQKDVIVLRSGLQYKVLNSGREGPSPTAFDQVTIHYSASFLNGMVFENTFAEGQPKKIPVNQMIPGWSEAIKMMHVGDKWQLYVPSYLAYGETGYPPAIGPNALLIFEMELLSID